MRPIRPEAPATATRKGEEEEVVLIANPLINQMYKAATAGIAERPVSSSMAAMLR